MQLSPFNFQTIDWSTIPVEEHKGDSGMAYWQVVMMNDIRIRKVHYSAGYIADHWCKKGHVLFCVNGEMETTLEDGRIFSLSKDSMYIVGDDCEAHRSSTKTGCELFIVD
jgi:hypothetical protein